MRIGNFDILSSSSGALTLESAAWEGGRLLPGTGYDKVLYHVTDHLGSVRVVKDGTGAVLQRFDYYPFGSVSGSWSSSTNPSQPTLRHRFSGKEIAGQIVDASLVASALAGTPAAAAGTHYLDFGARLYDPRTAAWLSQDPMAEKYYPISPHAYCAGNPVLIFDMDGRELVIYYQDDTGRKYAHHFTGKTGSHPNPFVNDVIQAYHNSKTVWEKAGFYGHSPLVTLVESDYLVSVTSAGIEGNTFSKNYNTIYWDSKRGLKTDNGVLSPATGLEHEADHALAFNKDPKSYETRVSTPDKNYDNKEELRVIRESEQKIAIANGEISKGQVTRKDHSGLPVIVKNVTSNEVDVLKNDIFQKAWESFKLYMYSSE